MHASRTRTRRGTAGRTIWIIIAAKKLWMPKVWTQLHVTGTRGSTNLSVLFPGSRNGTPRGKMERFRERSEDGTFSRGTQTHLSVVSSHPSQAGPYQCLSKNAPVRLEDETEC